MIPEDINLEELDVKPYEAASVLMGRDDNLDPVLVVKPADPGDLSERVETVETKVGILETKAENLDTRTSALEQQMSEKADQTDFLQLRSEVDQHEVSINRIDDTLETVQNEQTLQGNQIDQLIEDDKANVKITGNQSIQGEKTFETGVTLDHGADLKLMYDDEDPSNPTFILGETPNGTQYNVAGLRSYPDGNGGFFNQTEYGSKAIQWNGNTSSYPTFDHPSDLDWTAQFLEGIPDTKSVVVLHRQLQNALSNYAGVTYFTSEDYLKITQSSAYYPITQDFVDKLRSAISARRQLVFATEGQGDMLIRGQQTTNMIYLYWPDSYNTYRYTAINALQINKNYYRFTNLQITQNNDDIIRDISEEVNFTNNNFKIFGRKPATLPDGGDGTKYLADDGTWKDVSSLGSEVEIITYDEATKIKSWSNDNLEVDMGLPFYNRLLDAITNNRPIKVVWQITGFNEQRISDVICSTYNGGQTIYMIALSWTETQGGNLTPLNRTTISDNGMVNDYNQVIQFGGYRKNLGSNVTEARLDIGTYWQTLDITTRAEGQVKINGKIVPIVPNGTGNSFLSDDGSYKLINSGKSGSLEWAGQQVDLEFTFEDVTVTVSRVSLTGLRIFARCPNDITLLIAKSKKKPTGGPDDTRATPYDITSTDSEIDFLTVGDYIGVEYRVYYPATGDQPAHSYQMVGDATDNLELCWIDISKHY